MISDDTDDDEDAQLDSQYWAKVRKVMDITDKTDDEVRNALFDCGLDETKAIELLIEGGRLGSWKETGKKKQTSEDMEEDWDNENFDPNNYQGANNKWEEENRGPPRLRRGAGELQGGGGRDGGGSWAPQGVGGDRRDGDSWKSKDLGEGDCGRGRGMGPRSGRRGDVPLRQKGRGGNDGRFGGNRGDYGGGPEQERGGEAEGFGATDTWNPVGEERRGRGNTDAFDNAGTSGAG